MSISRHQAVGAYRRWEPAEFGSDEPVGASSAGGKRPPRVPATPAAADERGAAAPGPNASPRAASTAGAPPAAANPAPAPELSLPPDFHLPTADEMEAAEASGFYGGGVTLRPYTPHHVQTGLYDPADDAGKLRPNYIASVRNGHYYCIRKPQPAPQAQRPRNQKR